MDQKDGVKTSEFWTAMLTIAAGAIPAVAAALQGNTVVAAIVSAVSLVGPAVYIWGRSILKAEQTHATDVLPDAWEQRLSDILDVVERLTQGLAKKE